MDSLCHLLIYYQNNYPVSLITGLGDWKFFNIFEFLPDICENSSFEAADSNADNTEFRQFSIDELFQFNNQSKLQYDALINGIRDLMSESYESQSPISMHSIALLTPYFDITYKFTPFIKTSQEFLNSSPSYPELSINYLNMNMADILSENYLEYTAFSYECFSAADLIFAILHYLSLTHYKFQKCMHCDRYFVTNNLKNSYCNRKSELEGYQKYSCYDAAKEAKRTLKAKYRRLYQRFYARRDEASITLWNNFSNSWGMAVEKLKKHPNYAAITECQTMLSEIENK